MYSKLKAAVWAMLLLPVASCSNTAAGPAAIVPVQDNNTPPIQPVKFKLTAEPLETNLRRLLGQYADYQHIYWNVSQRHQVVAGATVTADDLYGLIDKIIAPYNKPAQVRATFYRANGVVTFDYNRLMGNRGMEQRHE